MDGIVSSQFWSTFIQEKGTRALDSAIQIVFIVLLFVIARAVVFRLITRSIDVVTTRGQAVGRPVTVNRTRTLGGLLRSVTSYVLLFIAVFMILKACGVELLPILTAASVVGLAVGFGAQKLVKDVISGFFILLENQYSVGEYVTIGTITGTVEDLGMRTTWIRDEIGKLSIIANGDITLVTNHSRGAVTTSIDVSVAPGTNLDKACSVLRSVGEKIAEDRRDVFAPFTCDGLAAMDAAKITLRLVGRVEPTAQQDVQMDLRARAREALMKNEIQIA